AFEFEIFVFEMTQVDEQWHNNLLYAISDKPRLRLAQLCFQCLLHFFRNERAHVSAEPRDFLYDARTQERVSVLGHHKNRFNPLLQFTVHQGELKFKFEILLSLKAADDRLSATALHVII